MPIYLLDPISISLGYLTLFVPGGAWPLTWKKELEGVEEEVRRGANHEEAASDRNAQDGQQAAGRAARPEMRSSSGRGSDP